jgi:hypothetical protein
MTLIQPIMEKAVEDFREKPLDQRKADLRQIFRLYDLQDLKGAEFRRLLSLARDEGLLAALGSFSGINMIRVSQPHSRFRNYRLNQMHSHTPLRGSA